MISHLANQAQPHCSWLKLIRSIDRARPVASSTSTIAPQMALHFVNDPAAMDWQVKR